MKARYRNEFGFAEMWRVGDTWVLHLLYVHPDSRRRGHGWDLMEDVLTDADVEGVTVALQVAAEGGPSDEDLKSWYEVLGFVEDDRFPGNRMRLIRKPVVKGTHGHAR